MANSSSSTRSARNSNCAAGGNRAAPAAVPADALSSNDGVVLNFVNPFSSASHIALSELSVSGLWTFISANCGSQMAPYQSSWTEKNLRGATLLRVHPADFDAEMSREFPTMSISQRMALFNFVKQFVARDLSANHALKVYVDPAFGQIWANSTFEQPVAKRLREEQPLGGGNAQFISPKRLAQHFVFGTPSDNVAVSPADKGPPLGNFAPPFGARAPPPGSYAPSFGNFAPPSGLPAPPIVGLNPSIATSFLNQSSAASGQRPALSEPVSDQRVAAPLSIHHESLPMPIQSLDPHRAAHGQQRT